MISVAITYSSEVPIAECGGSELAVCNGLQECPVGGVADAQGSYAMTVVGDGRQPGL